MKHTYLQSIFCVFVLGINSNLSYAMDDMPIWVTTPLTDKGISASSEAETEENALAQALWQLTLNINAKIEALVKAYKIPDKKTSEINKTIASYKYGDSLSVKGMDKLDDTEGTFNSTFKIEFVKGNTNRIYAYSTQAKLDNSDYKQSNKVTNSALSYHDLKTYLTQNGFSILTHHGVIKDVPMIFVWINYAEK